MTLQEKIYKLNSLIAEMQEKRNSINAAIDKAVEIRNAVKFLEEDDESDEIAINVSGYGYPAVSGAWETHNLYVSRDDFRKFLEDQREKHLTAADKLVGELLEETRERE